MDKKYMQVYHGLVSWYRHNCVDDAKILEDSINAGEAVSLFSTLLNDLFSAELKYEKLFHIARLFHFYDYCKSYNNGIPLLEIVGDMIDSSQKSKIINAVKSQKNLVEFLIREGADIVTLADYVADNETIEYAINEEKKSTGVLKRIIGRKQLISANPETEVNPKKRVKQIIGISDWCIVFYYLDEAGAKKVKKRIEWISLLKKTMWLTL